MKTIKIMVSLFGIMLCGYTTIAILMNALNMIKLSKDIAELLPILALFFFFVLVYPFSKSLKTSTKETTQRRQVQHNRELVELEKYKNMINDEIEEKVYFDDDDFMIFDMSDMDTREIVSHIMKYIKYKYQITEELTTVLDFPSIRFSHLTQLNSEVLGA